MDRVELLILPEMETSGLKEPDWTSVMTSYGDASTAQREALFKRDDEWDDMETLFSCCTLLVFNQWKVGVQKHRKFRQALHHIIDRERMIAKLGGELLYPAQGFRPDPTVYDKLPATNSHIIRSEIAALLHESGYRGETFRVVTNPYHEADAVWIRERCKSFGINMEIEVKKPSEWTDLFSLQQHDCLLFGNVFTNDEVCELEMYRQKNYFLSAFDEQTAEAVKKATESIFREPDEGERQRKLANLEDLMRQTYSILYLVHKKSNTSFHKSVRGVRINSFGWLDFHKIWFQPQVLH